MTGETRGEGFDHVQQERALLSVPLYSLNGGAVGR